MGIDRLDELRFGSIGCSQIVVEVAGERDDAARDACRDGQEV